MALCLIIRDNWCSGGNGVYPQLLRRWVAALYGHSSVRNMVFFCSLNAAYGLIYPKIKVSEYYYKIKIPYHYMKIHSLATLLETLVTLYCRAVFIRIHHSYISPL